MMKFKVSDQRKMPIGLEPTPTSENLRPPEYYKAIRQQKIALSSLSQANEHRSEGFLKAHSSE